MCWEAVIFQLYNAKDKSIQQYAQEMQIQTAENASNSLTNGNLIEQGVCDYIRSPLNSNDSRCLKVDVKKQE